MPIFVAKLSNGKIARFQVPSGMTEAEAARYVEQNYDLNKPPESGFGAAVGAGKEELMGGLARLAGRMGLRDVQEAEAAAQKREDAARRQFTPTGSWSEAPVTKFLETLGGSVPYVVAPAAAALAAPVVGLPGALGAGTLATLASATQFAGSNLSRQVQEGTPLAETNLAGAAATGLGQGLLDTVGFRLIPGVRRIFGAAGKEITEEQARAIATQSLRAKAMDYTRATGKAMTAEGLTETGQQVLERLQAGLSLTDEKARDEYFDSFIGGAVLAGAIGPAGRYAERSKALSDLEAKDRKKALDEQKAAAAEQQKKVDAFRAELPQYTRADLLTAQADFQGLIDSGDASVQPYLKAVNDAIKEYDKLLEKDAEERAKTAKASMLPAKESAKVFTGETAQPLPEGAITKDDIDAFVPMFPGVKSYKGFFNKHVVGKTKEEIRAMVEADPTLVEGKSAKAKVLKFLTAFEPAAYEEPTNVPVPTVQQPAGLEPGGGEPSVGVPGPTVESGPPQPTVTATEPVAPPGGRVGDVGAPPEAGAAPAPTIPPALEETRVPQTVEAVQAQPQPAAQRQAPAAAPAPAATEITAEQVAPTPAPAPAPVAAPTPAIAQDTEEKLDALATQLQTVTQQQEALRTSTGKVPAPRSKARAQWDALETQKMDIMRQGADLIRPAAPAPAPVAAPAPAPTPVSAPAPAPTAAAPAPAVAAPPVAPPVKKKAPPAKKATVDQTAAIAAQLAANAPAVPDDVTAAPAAAPAQTTTAIHRLISEAKASIAAGRQELYDIQDQLDKLKTKKGEAPKQKAAKAVWDNFVAKEAAKKAELNKLYDQLVILQDQLDALEKAAAATPKPLKTKAAAAAPAPSPAPAPAPAAKPALAAVKQAWADMAPEGAIKFETLPAAQKAKWTALVEANKASAADADAILEEANLDDAPLQKLHADRAKINSKIIDLKAKQVEAITTKKKLPVAEQEARQAEIKERAKDITGLVKQLEAMDNTIAKSSIAIKEAEKAPIEKLPDTIDVDGVQRPTTNSEGRQIHPTRVGVTNFWKWFGKSVVVDKDGRPIPMYHGTAQNIKEFIAKQAKAIFFSPDPKFSESFAGFSKEYMLRNYAEFLTPEQIETAKQRAIAQVEKDATINSTLAAAAPYTKQIIMQIGDTLPDKAKFLSAPYGKAQQAFESEVEAFLPSHPNLIAAYIKAVNPFDYANKKHIALLEKWKAANAGKSISMNTAKGVQTQDVSSINIARIKNGMWPSIEAPAVQKALKDLGFDGMYMSEWGTKNLAVYYNSQIKSAIGNLGSYLAAISDIRYRATNEKPAKPMPKAELTAAVQRINRMLGGVVDVKILDSVTDLNPELKAGSRAGAMIGDQMYLFRDGIASGIEGEQTILHELLHRGLRRILPGAAYNRELTRLYTTNEMVRERADAWAANNAKVRKEAEADYRGANPKAPQADVDAFLRALAVDEALAEIAQTPRPNPALLKRIGLWLSGIAERFGLKRLASMLRSDSAEVDAIVRKALREAVKGRKEIAAVAETPVDDSQYIDEVPRYAMSAAGKAIVASRPQHQQQPLMQMIRSSVGGVGFNQQTVNAITNAINKMRFRVVDRFATVEQKFARLFTDGVRDAQGNINPMLLLRQAESSEQLISEFYDQGSVRFNPKTLQWEVYSDPRVRPPKAIFDVLKRYADDEGISFAAARRQAALTLEAVRLYYLRQDAPQVDRHMTDAEIDQLMAEYQNSPILQELSATMDESRKEMINHLEAVGRLTAQDAKDMREAVGYVPFNRSIDESMNDFVRLFREKRRTGRGLAQLGTLPELIGSRTRPVNDVFENYLNLMGWMVKQTVRQSAVQASLNTLVQMGMARVTASSHPDYKDREVRSYVNGEEKVYRMDSPYDAAAFLDRSRELSGITKFLGQFSNILRTSVTAFPTFAVKQIADDVQRAALHSGVRDVAGLTAMALSNFASLSKSELAGKSNDLKKLFAEKGLVGDVDFRSDNPAKTLMKNLGIEPRGRFAELVHRMDGISRASDLAIRSAIYEMTMRETGDEALAIQRAREIINFRRRGAGYGGAMEGALPFLIHTIPFFNAWLQGLDVLYRSLTGAGAASGLERQRALKAFYTRAGIYAGIATVYTLMKAGDDDYDGMEINERDRSWVLGGGVALPVPTELGILFKAIPERVLEYYRRSGTPEEQAATEAMTSYFKAAFDTYFGRSVPIPQAARPLLEVITNHSFLTGRELEGIYQKGLLPSARYNSMTSELAKSIAKFTKATAGVEISPISIDTVLNGYFGTTATMFTAITDGIINPNKTDRPLHKMVGLAPFSYNVVGTRRTNEFYDLNEKVRETRNTYLALAKENPERATEFLNEKKDLLALAKMTNATQEQLEKTRAYKRWLETDAAASMYSSEQRLEKVQEVQRYEQQITDWVRRAKAMYPGAR